jgi:hypothetical protein
MYRAENLYYPPLCISMIMDRRIITWTPRHNHDFEIAAIMDKFAAITVLLRMIKIGVMHEIIHVDMGFCYQLSYTLGRELFGGRVLS